MFLFGIAMAFRNTRSRAGAAGRSGRASDDLAAALDAALALEDADDDGSFAVIATGSLSGRRTPVGVGESSSLGLPPRPARTGRALSGGKGGDVDRGSSASSSLGPRGNSSPNCHRPWYWREIYPDYGVSC